MALGVSADVLIPLFVAIGLFMAELWLFVFLVECQNTSAERVGKVVAVLLVVVPVTVVVPVYRDDGVYSGVRCSRTTVATKVEIGPEGFLIQGCVDTYGKVTFVSRTEETSSVLCVGRNGECFPDEVVPRELRARLVVEPGETREWEFPLRWVLWTELARSYPVTLSGLTDVAAPDLVVRRALRHHVRPDRYLVTANGLVWPGTIGFGRATGESLCWLDRAQASDQLSRLTARTISTMPSLSRPHRSLASGSLEGAG